MPVLLLRTLIVYLSVIAVMRLMGKRQLGELQPSELVTTILISNLASISIESPEAPLLASLSPVLMLTVLELLLSALTFRSGRAARWLSGRPVIVVRDGQPDQDALRMLRFSMGDLLKDLRSKDIFELEQVACAIVETNGTLTVCRRPQDEPPTRAELGKAERPARRPTLPFLLDGCIFSENLRWCGRDEAWLHRFLEQQHVPMEQVLALLGNDTEQYTLIKKAAGKRQQTEGEP